MVVHDLQKNISKKHKIATQAFVSYKIGSLVCVGLCEHLFDKLACRFVFSCRDLFLVQNLVQKIS